MARHGCIHLDTLVPPPISSAALVATFSASTTSAVLRIDIFPHCRIPPELFGLVHHIVDAAAAERCILADTIYVDAVA